MATIKVEITFSNEGKELNILDLNCDGQETNITIIQGKSDIAIAALKLALSEIESVDFKTS